MPWANVPESKWPEMERCVNDVMAGGKDKDAATAICYSSVMGKEARTAASFAIFKQADGQHRWVLFSSSSFKDRDGEFVTQSAQEVDTDQMWQSGDFGTLDWWHVVPQAYDATEWSTCPAPGGLIIGDCDFAAMQGKIRVESGTFRSKAVAEAVAAHEKELGASLSFYHPLSEPDADGAYWHIKTFSRAILPASKESNLATQVFVQGGQMASLKNKMDAFVKLVGDEAAKLIVGQAEQTQQEKEAQGVTSKEETASAPKENEPEVNVEVKANATPPPPPKPDETQKPEASAGGPKLADLSVEDFAKAMAAAMQPMMDKMDAMMGAMGGAATAEAKENKTTLTALATELKEIKSTLAATAQTVKELNGDTARRGFRASTADETITNKGKHQEPHPDSLGETINKHILSGTAVPPA